MDGKQGMIILEDTSGCSSPQLLTEPVVSLK